MKFTQENMIGYNDQQLVQLNAELAKRLSAAQDDAERILIEAELRKTATEFLAMSDPTFPSENRSQGFEGKRHSFGSTNAK